mmetsp:Transcript_6943/g.10581  ORF Transcript_6943/g.10581 Transcript_6943/m.10581 type:complete len:212 (-) Transcript_6943:11760-12395(-)
MIFPRGPTGMFVEKSTKHFRKKSLSLDSSASISFHERYFLNARMIIMLNPVLLNTSEDNMRIIFSTSSVSSRIYGFSRCTKNFSRWVLEIVDSSVVVGINFSSTDTLPFSLFPCLLSLTFFSLTSSFENSEKTVIIVPRRLFAISNVSCESRATIILFKIFANAVGYFSKRYRRVLFNLQQNSSIFISFSANRWSTSFFKSVIRSNCPMSN